MASLKKVVKAALLLAGVVSGACASPAPKAEAAPADPAVGEVQQNLQAGSEAAKLQAGDVKAGDVKAADAGASDAGLPKPQLKPKKPRPIMMKYGGPNMIRHIKLAPDAGTPEPKE